MNEIEEILDTLIFNLDLKPTPSQRIQWLGALKRTYNKGVTDSAKEVELADNYFNEKIILKLLIP